MTQPLNPYVLQADAPAIGVVRQWVGLYDGENGPLIDVAQAVPDAPPAGDLARHLSDLILAGEASKYTAINGLVELRDAFAKRTGDIYGGVLTAEHVSITAGCNQAFCLATQAVLQPGDEVLIPVPWYFNHKMWLDMLNVRAVPVPFPADRGGVLTVKDFAALVTDRTRAIILVNPSNPTGVLYPPSLISDLADLVRDRGAWLILDETYRDYRPDRADAPHTLFQRADWRDHLIQLYSFSKVYRLSGYRVGALVAGPEVLEAVTRIMDTTQICAPHIGQRAALFGLLSMGEWLNEQADDMLGRGKAFVHALAGTDTGVEIVSAGAFFGYVRHPFRGEPGEEVALRLCREFGILTVPGSFFGPGQDEYLRVAFGNISADEMPALARRLAIAKKAWV